MNATTADTTLAAALACIGDGISIVAADWQTKLPAFDLLPKNPTTGKAWWEPFMSKIADEATVRGWFGRGCQAFAVIGGAVSGGLYAFDFDELRFWKAWYGEVGELVDQAINDGYAYLEKSPREGGGRHFIIRIDGAPKNQKLAWVEDATEDSGRRVAIETRGERGYLLVSPSRHQAGYYEAVAGSLLGLKVMPADWFEVFNNAAIGLDECPHPITKQIIEQAKAKGRANSNGSTGVIDLFNAKNDAATILLRHGYTRHTDTKLNRPGDGTLGSVTLRDGLSVHYSSNDPLNDSKFGNGLCGIHSAFDSFLMLEHRGDLKAAVRAAAVELGVEHETSPKSRLVDGGRTMEDPTEAESVIPAPDYIDAGELLTTYQKLRPAIIDAIARMGDVGNLIGATKTRKSWMALELLLCVASGRAWLGRFAMEQGLAILIDNELHPSDLAYRIREVARDMGLMREDYENRLKVWSLRGRLMDVHKLCAMLERLEPCTIKVIVLDSLYRLLPAGTNENDNAQITAIYNRLAAVAAKLGAVLVIVHHSSKGSQGAKTTTDVAAGAGAFSRTVDFHFVTREHQEPDCVVAHLANRSFPPMPAFVLRWQFPRYRIDESLDPANIKTDKRPGGRPRKDAEENPVWTPNTFAEGMITAEPQTADEIVWTAKEAGMSGRNAMSLLRAAVAKKLAFEWPKANRNLPSYFANREPTLAEIPKPEPKGKGKRAKAE